MFAGGVPGESSGLLPDFVDWESLRVGCLGELIGWWVMEARRLVEGWVLGMGENEMGY